MQRSRLYHLILLASAVAVLAIGSLIRSRMLRTNPRTSGEAGSSESTVLREIQQLRRAFTRNEAATLREATRTITMMEMPWLVLQVRDEFPGYSEIVFTIVLASVLVNEVIGPVLTKLAIKRAGEAHERPVPAFSQL